jgi:cytochrome c biogenesis protein CcmG, thiol:disulfide interchange protein DsbE
MNYRRNGRWMCWSGVGVLALAAGLSLPATAQSGAADTPPTGTQPEEKSETERPTLSDRQTPAAERSRELTREQQAERERRARERTPAEREAELRRVGQELPIRRLEDAPRSLTPQQINPSWRQTLPAIDRIMLHAMVGFAPPDFTDDLQWHGHNPAGDAADQKPDWLQFRDRIVVVQTWTSANSAGRQAKTDAINAISEFSTNDVALILVHTPEGHDGAAGHVEHASNPNVSIVVDHNGAWLDEAGIYRTPVNFIVDRNGTVRFGGLTPDGITAAIASIIDEEYDEHGVVNPLPPIDRRLHVAFPTVRGNPGTTPDVQGQVGPDVYVPEWFNDPPSSLRGKVIKVEFWRTGCPHCINAIPKLNETYERFSDDLVIVAITHESPDQLRQGLRQRNVDPDGVKYPIGIDPQRRTAQQLGVRGVPHSIVMSSDGIVRWQGHPAQLQDQVLEQIIVANNAMFARTEIRERRWVKN